MLRNTQRSSVSGFQAQQHSWQPQNLDYLIVSMLGSTEGTYYIDGPPISPPISSPNKLGNQLRRVLVAGLILAANVEERVEECAMRWCQRNLALSAR